MRSHLSVMNCCGMFELGECPSVGDDPPRDRTSELRALGFPTRHLGPMQMTTDTALGVTNIVVQDRSAYSSGSIVSLVV